MREYLLEEKRQLSLQELYGVGRAEQITIIADPEEAEKSADLLGRSGQFESVEVRHSLDENGMPILGEFAIVSYPKGS